RPRVQPFSMIGLGWLAYVRTDYRDSTNNKSHQTSSSNKSRESQFRHLHQINHENHSSDIFIK
ncbi:hypothetical protein MEO39_15480, partial [Dolichospermum sp. ST_sed2]|nr:hypothetical protein [Dolichospermum sp. ST_sed2]